MERNQESKERSSENQNTVFRRPLVSTDLFGLFFQNGFNQFLRAVVRQLLGDCASECVGVGGGGLRVRLQDDRAVGVSDQSAQGEQAVFFGALRRKRDLAASAQSAGEGAFGGYAGVCDVVV